MKHALLDAVAGLSRRQVLGFAGAVVLSACGGGNGGSGPSDSTGGTGGAGGGASGGGAGRISVVAGSATGAGPVEHALTQIESTAFDPATGGLVVNIGEQIVRYPVTGATVDMGAGVATRYLLPFTGWKDSLEHSRGGVVDPAGNAYTTAWYLDGVVIDTHIYRSGELFQISPTGGVMSSLSDRAGTQVLPDGMALLPDGTLAFFDILSGWLMRWQVGKGLTRLVQLVPSRPEGTNSFEISASVALASAPTGVYVFQDMKKAGQNGTRESFIRTSLWNAKALTFIADVAMPAGFTTFSHGMIAANSGQVVFAVDRWGVDVVAQPWMALLQPNGQVRPLDVSTFQGSNLPEVSTSGWGLSMAFAPDGAVWMVRKFGASGGALLRIELQS